MNIYVGNLSLEMTQEELRRAFAAFGVVLSVNIMNDRYIGSGQSRGYGFVEMPLFSEGQAAIAELNGKMMKNRLLSVIQALPLSNSSGAGHYDSRKGNRFSGKARQRV